MSVVFLCAFWQLIQVGEVCGPVLAKDTAPSGRGRPQVVQDVGPEARTSNNFELQQKPDSWDISILLLDYLDREKQPDK